MRTFVGMNIERNQQGKIRYPNRSRFVIPPELEDMTASIRDFVADPDHHPKTGRRDLEPIRRRKTSTEAESLGPRAIRQMRDYVQLAVDTRSAGPVDIHGASGRVFG